MQNTIIDHLLPALCVAFVLGSILGYFSQRLRLSPLLGYLLAGYIVGPYSPGIFIDVKLSEQLAEIGVVLMMFGVGMHFKWQDLSEVKYIAIFGAIGQTIIATSIGTMLVALTGFPFFAALVIGLSISVASTVVLVRVLGDNHLLHSYQGHVAVGWLIAEDLITVVMLILLPFSVQLLNGMEFSWQLIGVEVFMLALKFMLLFLLMFTLGKWVVSYILFKVSQLKSEELFTLTILALIFAIALGAAILFGTSIALGAFIAGMIIGQTALKHQASANALPLRDAFVVLFFLSVGMIFNPMAIFSNFTLFLAVLFTVLLVKPIAAFCLAKIFRQRNVVALTVTLALAQIGEFSFILSEEAIKLHILADEGYDIIVAVALISIALNPLLFRLFGRWCHEPDSLPESVEIQQAK